MTSFCLPSPVRRFVATALVATTALGLNAGPAFAQAPAAASPAARLVPAASEVVFTARQVGVPLQGQFKRFSAAIALDPRQPQAGKVGFTVELGSVGIDPETDRELLKPEWFSTARFPTAQFTSSAIKATGPGKFEVQGTLAIKGQTRPLTVPVSLTQAGGQSVATGTFTLRRLDFKVGDGDWADTSVVANDVQVRFKLTLTGMPPL